MNSTTNKQHECYLVQKSTNMSYVLHPWIGFWALILPSNLLVGARIEAVLEWEYADGPIKHGGCPNAPLH